MTSDQPKRRRGRPATGRDPSRSVRIGPIWDQARLLAKERGDRFAEIIERALTEYVEAHTK